MHEGSGHNIIGSNIKFNDFGVFFFLIDKSTKQFLSPLVLKTLIFSMGFGVEVCCLKCETNLKNVYFSLN